MIIKKALIFSEKGFQEGNLYIENGRITDQIPDEYTSDCIDAAGLYAIPGLVDLHFHGAMGNDFCNGNMDSIRAIAEFEAENGVLAICPATMTFSEEILLPIMKAAKNYREMPSETGADLVGINMEGPFISPDKVGAQNPLYVCKASQDMFDRLQNASGNLIRLVDIAPEEEGNLTFIENNCDRVRISVAHTCTDYDTAKEAFSKGAKHVTHLFNAMPPVNHRNPGPVIAALEEADVTVELIADGIHIHPAMVRFIFNTFGSDRVVLISDSLESTGLPDGKYMLGGQSITVKGKKAVLTEKPDTIAGSSSTLFDVLKTTVTKMGIPMEQAVKAATINPAKALGIQKDYGSLTEGSKGNVLLVDSEMNLIHVMKDGRLLK